LRLPPAFQIKLRRVLTRLAFACALGTLPSAALAQPVSTERIEAELVPMSAWAAPGSTAVVAVRQKIAPGWHTYWRNPGDSGGATSLDWTLPSGVRAGDIVWPLPQRQRLQGLMNYGYSGEVFLPVPIEIPASARPGSTIRLTTRALFLVCSDQMCVPDQLTLSLDLPVKEGAAPLATPYGRRIQATVEAAPRPAGITAHVARDGRTLRLTATGGPLAGATLTHASFFPYQGRIIDHAAIQFGRAGPNGLTLDLAAGSDPSAGQSEISGVLATDTGAWEITATPGLPLPGTTGTGSLAPTEDAAPAKPIDVMTVVQAALFALIGGLILNLMPCVFPILAMKAAALARSAHDPVEARRDGLGFLFGVLVAFAALAMILLVLRAGGQAIGWGFQLQSPGVVAGLALLMLAVGLNLSGVFAVGGGLQNLGARPSPLPGWAGAFLTGVLAVVVAAPCTAPFMAVALGAALTMPAPLALLVFLMLGLGLALPYVLISLSPGLLRRLPRPGPWMETLRGLLAFAMYGAGLWLVWVFARQTGMDALALLLGAALALALALWLWGKSQTADDKAGLVARVSAAVALILAIGLTVMAVRLPQSGTSGAIDAATAIPSRPWSEQAVAEARAQGRPVLVNLTADWCVTCKINERTSLSSPRVARALSRTNALYLVGDWTRRDDAITRELQRHGRSGVPLYLAYVPGEPAPRVLPQLLSEGVVIEALEGPRSSTR